MYELLLGAQFEPILRHVRVSELLENVLADAPRAVSSYRQQLRRSKKMSSGPGFSSKSG